MAHRGEFDQIAALFAPLTRGAPGALSLRDDAAVLDVPPGQQVVVTTDAIVAGVHYLPDDPPDLVARKLMRVNLSDLAAMGAEPLGLFATCAFPVDCSDAWVEAFARGLGEDVDAFMVPILGGDTVATPGPAVFSLTALGTVPVGQALRRSGAAAGDLLAVTGTLGDGAFGLRAARGELDGVLDPASVAWLADRYRLPQPRLALGVALRGIASAAMDISDGLLQDLGHLCAASGVGADLDAHLLPVSPAVTALAGRDGWLEGVAGGGDDYELLVAVAPQHRDALLAAGRAAGVAVTIIGRCGAGAGVRLRTAEGAVIEGLSQGFRHF
ncbi:MAG: thiamine-phosphate kinase [Rhodospirillaceae bacterium]